jgi:hypothetical protein
LANDSLRDIISVIVEELGHVSKNIFRGYGASSVTIRTSKPSLGDSAAQDAGEVKEITPVKVSKAFLAAQEEVEPAEA